jgi:mannose/fructose/N-acetylgalactosamine-specific phosphotransferase system component IIC
MHKTEIIVFFIGSFVLMGFSWLIGGDAWNIAIRGMIGTAILGMLLFGMKPDNLKSNNKEAESKTKDASQDRI